MVCETAKLFAKRRASRSFIFLDSDENGDNDEAKKAQGKAEPHPSFCYLITRHPHRRGVRGRNFHEPWQELVETLIDTLPGANATSNQRNTPKVKPSFDPTFVDRCLLAYITVEYRAKHSVPTSATSGMSARIHPAGSLSDNSRKGCVAFPRLKTPGKLFRG